MNRAFEGVWRGEARASALATLRLRSVIFGLIGASLAITACKTAPKPLPPEPAPVLSSAPPSWVKQPMSWEKLDAVEQWLEVEGPRHEMGLVIEGELQLNEGRLLFAQRDMEHKTVSPDTLRVRVEKAKEGFDKVIANTSASPGQRTRAQIGQRGSQALLGAPSPPAGTLTVISRAQWGAKTAHTDDLTPLKGQWSRVTVHHSAEETSDPDGGTLEESMQTVRSIQKYHIEDSGHQWGDIGYHFLIDSAGRIFEGRTLQWQGAHAGGVNNVQNIGVCLLGDLERRPASAAAKKSLELLLNHLRTQYRIPASRVYPHNELKTTRCPGPALTDWLKKYRATP